MSWPKKACAPPSITRLPPPRRCRAAKSESRWSWAWAMGQREFGPATSPMAISTSMAAIGLEPPGEILMISRRTVMAGSALLLPSFAHAADASIAALEKQSGARIGVAALDTGTGRRISNREHERFLMCSTFKLSLAAATLARSDAGRENLDRVIHYEKSQLLPVSPATTRNQATGMKIADLCQAAVIYSDNTAANLLLAALGGPGAVTAFWRSLGDPVSRLDDIELKLNVPDG